MIPRIEYGARLVSRAANVYMQAFDRDVVVAWMAEYASAGPAQLVTRIWTDDTHTGWVAS